MIVFAEPIEADVLRLRHEFLTMPTLCLSAAQTARLLGLRLDSAIELLEALERDGFLIRTPGGAYRRAEPPMS